MEFSFVCLDAAMSIPGLRNNFVRCLMTLTHACGLKNDMAMILKILSNPALIGSLITKTTGLYILHNETEICAMALVGRANVIDGIYVPEAHRRKGYASTLLENIGILFESLEVIPVFSPVAPHALGVFLKAGWKKCGSVNKDGSVDYTPESSMKRYNKIDRINRIKSDKKLTDMDIYMKIHMIPLMKGISNIEKLRL